MADSRVIVEAFGAGATAQIFGFIIMALTLGAAIYAHIRKSNFVEERGYET